MYIVRTGVESGRDPFVMLPHHPEVPGPRRTRLVSKVPPPPSPSGPRGVSPKWTTTTGPRVSPGRPLVPRVVLQGKKTTVTEYPVVSRDPRPTLRRKVRAVPVRDQSPVPTSCDRPGPEVGKSQTMPCLDSVGLPRVG